MRSSSARRVTAEFLGTLFLVATVVGSGIMGERLAGGNVAIALLANTIATGAALVALILTFGPISGAHLNPVVTLADAMEARNRVEGDSRIHFRADRGRNRRRRCRAFNVWAAGRISIAARAEWSNADIQRVHSDVRIAGGDLGMFAPAFECDGIRRGSVHHGSVLVHSVHVVREPRSDDRARAQQYFFGDTARGRAWIYPCANCRGDRRDAAVSLADSGAAVARERCGLSARKQVTEKSRATRGSTKEIATHSRCALRA